MDGSTTTVLNDVDEFSDKFPNILPLELIFDAVTSVDTFKECRLAALYSEI